ncbi:MAG: DUF1549 domain-containing protein [Fuerstiella sp.]
MTGQKVLPSLILLIQAIAAHGGDQQPPAAQLEFFENRIRPVLVEHCYRCHSQDAGKAEGSLLLDTAAGLKSGGDSGPAIDAENSAASPLLEAIRYEGLEMPPDGRLPESVIRDFEKWVRMGAPDPRIGEAGKIERRQIDLEAGRRFWAFRSVLDRKPPVRTESVSPIDAFLDVSLAEAGLEALPAASPEARIRRLYYDLIGLPPTVAQVREFVDQPDAATWTSIVDRLLTSLQFGVHWGRHWLDVARYADSNGGDFNATFHNAWRYRNYVVDSFNDDKPFDQFVREQLAGDLLPAASDQERTEQLVATGFLMLGTKMLSERDKLKLKMDVVDEQVNTVGAAFLGMTLGCARCHDHKFDPIPTQDYYALAGIFRSTQTLKGESQKYVSTWQKTALPIDPAHEQALREHEEKTKQLEREQKQAVEAVEQFEKSQRDHSPNVVDDDDAVLVGSWKESRLTPTFVGRGYRHDDRQGKGEKSITWTWKLPQDGRYDVRLSYTSGSTRAAAVPVEIRSAAGVERIQLDQTKAPNIDERFRSVGTFSLAGSTVQVTLSNQGTKGFVIADAVWFVALDTSGEPQLASTEKDYARQRDEQLQLLRQQAEAAKQALADHRSAAPAARPLALAAAEAEAIRDCEICIRGEHRNTGDVVPRGFLQVVSEAQPDFPVDESGRRELAEWIADASNPLTGRVIVNRVWAHLFGEGIVRSVDNFGALGQRPTHPELLDHLAARFVTPAGGTTPAGHAGFGWSIRKLIRELVMTEAYVRSTADSSEHRAIDPENRLLWKAHRRRLSAEAVRDSLLQISGRLDLSPAESPVQGLGVLVKNNQPDADEYQQSDSARRSLYLPIIRNELPPVLAVFDFADPDLVVGRRPVTNVPAQALFLLNSPFVMESADLTAERLMSASGGTVVELIDQIYEEVLSRRAAPGEIQQACEFLQVQDEQQSLDAIAEDSASSDEPLQTRVARLIHVLFASTEFRMLE